MLKVEGYGLLCSPEEEIVTFMTGVEGCFRQAKDGDICEMAGALDSCVQGVLNDCHDDAGEASAAFARGVAAVFAAAAKVNDERGFTTMLNFLRASCPGAGGMWRDLLQLDTAWSPAGPVLTPSEVEAALSGRVLTVNQVAAVNAVGILQDLKRSLPLQ